MKTTTTTYACDGCDKKTKQVELRRFKLTEKKMTGDVVATAKTELCVGCERQLYDAALRFFPEGEAEKLHGIVRG